MALAITESGAAFPLAESVAGLTTAVLCPCPAWCSSSGEPVFGRQRAKPGTQTVAAIGRAWQRFCTMLRRLLLGLLKGIVVGGAIGAALHFGVRQTSMAPGALNYVLYGTVALLAGVLAGQPPWRKGAWVASILKGIFGFGVGAGLYALASRYLQVPVEGLMELPAGTQLAQAPLLFAPAVATVYATLVELDDGGEAQPEEKTNVRVKADPTANIESVEVERTSKSAARNKR